MWFYSKILTKKKKKLKISQFFFFWKSHKKNGLGEFWYILPDCSNSSITAVSAVERSGSVAVNRLLNRNPLGIVDDGVWWDRSGLIWILSDIVRNPDRDIFVYLRHISFLNPFFFLFCDQNPKLNPRQFSLARFLWFFPYLMWDCQWLGRGLMNLCLPFYPSRQLLRSYLPAHCQFNWRINVNLL